MKVLYAANRYYPPHAHGGAQATIHTLLWHMQSNGHKAEAVVLASNPIRHQSSRILNRLSLGRFAGWPDNHCRYPTYRVSSAWPIYTTMLRRIKTFQPDILLMDKIDTLELLQKINSSIEMPVIFMVTDVDFLKRPASIRWHKNILPLSNSRFTANQIKRKLNLESPVIHPIIDFSQYRAKHREGKFITMINPLKIKGVDTVLKIAEKLPNRKFLLVGGWGGQDEEIDRRKTQIKHLNNVTLLPFQSDMRNIYSTTKILLVPTQIEEAFGRVVLESQANGIPVLAHDNGGLPESVGKGGFLIEQGADINRWVEQIEELFLNDSHYADLSEKAKKNTQRLEFSCEYITKTFLDLVQTHIQNQKN